MPWLSEPLPLPRCAACPVAALPRGCEMTASGQETTCFLLTVLGWGKHFFPQLANEGPK